MTRPTENRHPCIECGSLTAGRDLICPECAPGYADLVDDVDPTARDQGLRERG